MEPVVAFGAGGLVALLVALAGLIRELVVRRRSKRDEVPEDAASESTKLEQREWNEDDPTETQEEDLQMPIGLTAEQFTMVQIIKAEADAVGLGWLFQAAVVNAYSESLLDPKAVGDRGKSVGLFQLHLRGAGMGMTFEQRQDPAQNARRIFQVVLGPDGEKLRKMQAATIEEQTAAFAHDIERCSACGWSGGDSELHRRRALVAQLFPARDIPPKPRDNWPSS